MTHRPLCAACPWRDVDAVRAEFPDVAAYAESGGDGFVCHTRMGRCDGPAVMLARKPADTCRTVGVQSTYRCPPQGRTEP